jgi:hypothetical protein
MQISTSVLEVLICVLRIASIQMVPSTVAADLVMISTLMGVAVMVRQSLILKKGSHTLPPVIQILMSVCLELTGVPTLAPTLLVPSPASVVLVIG